MKKAFEFLNHLKENNNREWFAQHKSEYDVIVKENKVFFNQIYEKLQEHDQLKGIHIFRIYNDVRFSKNKTPYKTNFGVGYSRAKPMLRGGYYIQLEPATVLLVVDSGALKLKIYSVSVKNLKSAAQKLKELSQIKLLYNILENLKEKL
ncbi:uncharacterized protein (TIGR02453 family) [Chryseobacterium bernardetii]|uniref:Uncharacterized protein (TIGR02453 family) n=1 Tax=Chryseobacterium bernardetii TaxID=1241978 RepID=A0ACC6IPM4_9FLAO|nr:uncharacterized protein (TIGR02453 family) [Chryseobacterium vietnamense]MDR6439471.1 uncharacterized protein (TIGR02453 family) [Chryseobacterium bernardetii]